MEEGTKAPVESPEAPVAEEDAESDDAAEVGEEVGREEGTEAIAETPAEPVAEEGEDATEADEEAVNHGQESF